jgi:hypothetical protein
VSTETHHDQPPPIPNDRPAVWPLVMADVRSLGLAVPLLVALVRDMETRDQVGRQRYGTPLQPFNGRDALRDAYEEALDCAVYLRQEVAQGNAAAPGAYLLATELLVHLRRVLLTRDGR